MAWPLVRLVRGFAVAATMGQLASKFPTAGGLYHWAAIPGPGRELGLDDRPSFPRRVKILCWPRSMSAPNKTGAGLVHRSCRQTHVDLIAQVLGVGFITCSQAMINHIGIGLTARLTDFSGYWILLVAAALTTCLLIFAPGLEPSRLVTFENMSGTAGGGDVWPLRRPALLPLVRSCRPIRLPASTHRLMPRKRR